MSKWRPRLLALAFCMSAGLSAAGCADHGHYTVSWKFTDKEAGPGCGYHGVDSIRVTGASTQGDAEDIITLCAAPQSVDRPPGTFTHEVTVGDWTFTIHQLDVRGNPIVGSQWDAQGQLVLDMYGNPVPADDPTVTGSVPKDGLITFDQVTLSPWPACSDGVDNDGDRRIDFDDFDCMGSPNTITECPVTGC